MTGKANVTVNNCFRGHWKSLVMLKLWNIRIDDTHYVGSIMVKVEFHT